MIRQAAFTGSAPLLKGGLHCHTTRSDGAMSPEDVIRFHVQNGYDFLALTDHRIYNYKNYTDEKITILPGMEIDRNFPDPGVHCYHVVSIGPAREDGNGFEQDEAYPSGPVHDQFEFQPVLDELHAKKNLTIYCHPEWSGTPAREFDQMKGNFAMEIWNTGAVTDNELDMNCPYWDELLTQGQRIYGVATDDGHAPHQHCKGWVRVNAENNINAILAALENGAFYSSTGPEIHDFYINDEGVAVLECSPCRSIGFRGPLEPTNMYRNADGLITRAEFRVPKHLTYIRGIVCDEQGRRAWTNPIFLDPQ